MMNKNITAILAGFILSSLFVPAVSAQVTSSSQTGHSSENAAKPASFNSLREAFRAQPNVETLAQIEAMGVNGSGEAARFAAEVYARDEGFVNIEKALSLYEKAVEHGEVRSLVRLGDLYREGKLVEIDLAKARAFYQRASDSDDVEGKFHLGHGLILGTFGEINLALGTKLLDESAKAGNRFAAQTLGDFYARGPLAIDGPKAIAYYEKSNELGQASALTRIGDLYREGVVVPRDLKKAKTTYQEALTAGVVSGLVGLAQVEMMDTQEKPADPQQAVRYLEQAIAQGNAYALTSLIGHYRNGRGELLPKNMTKAEALFEQHQSLLSASALSHQAFLLKAGRANSINAFAELTTLIEASEDHQRPSMLRDLRWANANAYVYILQKRLQDMGHYNGPLNGLLTVSAIKAVSRLCGEAESPNACVQGPLSGPAVSYVASRLW